MNQENTESTRFPTDRASLERDSEVDFFTGSGPGGQHRNRSRTGVRIHHLPSDIVVSATERRSQSMNLEIAYQRLAERLEELNQVPKRRRPTRPSRGAKERRLKEKSKRSQTKKNRSKPGSED
jgi:protein subunit release factor B